jgi:putative glutamine amidotransferase
VTSQTNRKPTILVLEALTGSSQGVRDAGGLPLTANPRRWSEALLAALDAPWDGLLLTGGGDVDPRRYGEEPHEQVYGVNEVRDEVEFAALVMARERGVPVAGICRGMQVMAVEAGGSLRQHIGRGHYGRHDVATLPGSMLRAACGPGFEVVSYHHQALRRAPEGWRVTAAAGRVPEAIESPDGRCLGVQYHPEQDRWAVNSRRFFRWLVVEAAATRGAMLRPVISARPAQEQLNLDELLEASVERARAKPKGKARGRKMAGVRVSWVCPDCAIRFSNERDRDDHLRVLHGRDMGEPRRKARA